MSDGGVSTESCTVCNILPDVLGSTFRHHYVLLFIEDAAGTVCNALYSIYLQVLLNKYFPNMYRVRSNVVVKLAPPYVWRMPEHHSPMRDVPIINKQPSNP